MTRPTGSIVITEPLALQASPFIGQIHLHIEVQCGTPVYLWVTATGTVCSIKFQDPSISPNFFIMLMRV